MELNYAAHKHDVVSEKETILAPAVEPGHGLFEDDAAAVEPAVCNAVEPVLRRRCKPLREGSLPVAEHVDGEVIGNLESAAIPRVDKQTPR